MKIEYKVREVTRYIVTRYEEGEHGLGSSSVHGEYDNHDMAYEVAYALAKLDHSKSGLPPGDERIIYPTTPCFPLRGE